MPESALFGGTGLAHAYANFKKKRAFADLATIDIASAPQGYVELSGFAWPLAPLSDLDGRPVAYLRWELQEYISRGKSSEWVTRAGGQPAKGFILHDTSGAAWVDMTHRQLECQQKLYPWKDIPAAQQSLVLSWLGTDGPAQFPPVTSGFFSRSFRVRVEQIRLGAPVTAQGNFTGVHEYAKSVMRGLSDFKQRYQKFASSTTRR